MSLEIDYALGTKNHGITIQIIVRAFSLSLGFAVARGHLAG
jgi:hypothetical protein